MLVKCPKCNVEFSPSMAHCPRCGVWQPGQQQIDDFWIEQIQLALSERQKTDQIRADLIASGFERASAHNLIAAAIERSKPKYRRIGLRKASRSLLAMAASWLIYTFGIVLGLEATWIIPLFAFALLNFVARLTQARTGKPG